MAMLLAASKRIVNAVLRTDKRYLYLAGLWAATLGFAVITALTYIAAAYPVNCDYASEVTFDSTLARCKTSLAKDIAYTISKHSSLVQSLYGYMMTAPLLFAALLFVPCLWSMTWYSIKQGTTVRELQVAVDLGKSTSIWAALHYIWVSSFKSRKNLPLAFIISIGLLNIASGIFAGFIFRDGWRPISLSTNYTVGGTRDDANIGNVANAAAQIIASNSWLNVEVISPTGNPQIVPAIFKSDISAIWSATLDAVVMYTAVDCSHAELGTRFLVPVELFNYVQKLPVQGLPYGGVEYYDTAVDAEPRFLGFVAPQPSVWLTYDKWPTVTATDWSSHVQVIGAFIGTNVSIEGAMRAQPLQPIPEAWISYIDILACRIDIDFEVSACTIQHGQIITCLPNPNAGSLADYMIPLVLELAAVAPFEIVPAKGSRLPSLSIFDIYQHQKVVKPENLLIHPTPWDTNYTLPQDYLTSTLIPTTQNVLVEGIVRAGGGRVQREASIEINGHFATSLSWLQITILTVVTSIGIISTISACHPSALKAQDPSIVRFVATSTAENLHSKLRASDGVAWDEDIEDCTVNSRFTEVDGVLVRELVFRKKESDMSEMQDLLPQVERVSM